MSQTTSTAITQLWVKLENDDIIGDVPETLAKTLFNFMKSQQIKIMDSEVTGHPRPATEGKWVIGGGMEIPAYMGQKV